MHKGFAITLAWPETLCKRAGAWYDYPMHHLGVSKNGYYRVGHAAVILVNPETGICQYFDFGRYHSPHGHGRVRSAESDHDLILRTQAIFSHNKEGIDNLEDILCELYHNPSTHGTGMVHANTAKINFDKSLIYSKKLQQKEFVPYGPFVRNGTNCSRFVSSVLKAGLPLSIQKLKLIFPLTISPTPIWNLRALGGGISRFGRTANLREELPQCSESQIITA